MSFDAFPSVFQAVLWAFRNHPRDEIVPKTYSGGDLAQLVWETRGFWHLLTPRLVIDDLPVNSGQFPCLLLESLQTLQLGCGQRTGRCRPSVSSVVTFLWPETGVVRIFLLLYRDLILTSGLTKLNSPLFVQHELKEGIQEYLDIVPLMSKLACRQRVHVEIA